MEPQGRRAEAVGRARRDPYSRKLRDERVVTAPGLGRTSCVSNRAAEWLVWLLWQRAGLWQCMPMRCMRYGAGGGREMEERGEFLRDWHMVAWGFISVFVDCCYLDPFGEGRPAAGGVSESK